MVTKVGALCIVILAGLVTICMGELQKKDLIMEYANKAMKFTYCPI